jgi:predicted nucleic-acid-binding Zn-ribbon protein
MGDQRDLKFECPKCGHKKCDVGEVRVSGGSLSAVFDVENRKFSSVTCEHCRYTEFYQTESGNLAKLFDLFTT